MTRYDEPSHRRYACGLLAAFCVVFVALGLRPSYRADWLLENVLVFLGILCLVLTYRSLPLSKISYTGLFVFFCLHEVGAHYTYSEVPYDRWSEAILGTSISSLLELDRNHFDRLVHLAYGLLIFYPVREIFLRVARSTGFWGYLFPVLLLMSTSLLYELLEWAAALLFGGDLGMAYLGTQGDVWDSHKDSLLATLGALVAALVVALVHRSLDRDFGREWIESLRVKQSEPLGEVAIQRLRKDRSRDS